MPVAPNNDFTTPTRLYLRQADTISSVGLTLQDLDSEPYDGDGKTAWWTFSTPTEGWFIFDATLTGDGDVTVQRKLDASVYRLLDGDPVDFNHLDYEEGFYGEDKAICAVFCHPDSIYYFEMDSIDYTGEYTVRVLPGKLGELYVTDPEPLSFDFAVGSTEHITDRFYATVGTTNAVTNSDTFNTYPIQYNWDQVRGVFPTSYGGASHRGYAGAFFGEVGYNREGQDIVGSVNYFAIQFAIPFIQIYGFEPVGGDRSTWPPDAAAVQADGHTVWNNITATATVIDSYEPGLGTIQSDHGSIRVDPYNFAYYNTRSPFANMQGTGESLTINLGNSTFSVFKQFQITPTRAANATPPTQNPVSPYRQGTFFKYSMNVTVDYVAAPFRFVLVDDGAGTLDGLQDVERARFW